MDLGTFFAHFLFIGLTFAGGVVVGWQTFEKAKPLLRKLKIRRPSSNAE